MMMSSRNAVAPVIPVSMASIVCWYIDGTVLTPKGRSLYLNDPLWVLIVRSSLESSSTSNCKNASKKSIFAKQISPFSLAKRSSGIGRGYWCVSCTLFSPVK